MIKLSTESHRFIELYEAAYSRIHRVICVFGKNRTANDKKVKGKTEVSVYHPPLFQRLPYSCMLTGKY